MDVSPLQSRWNLPRAVNLEEDTGPVLEGVSIVFAILTTIFLGLRFYSKQFTGAAGFTIDDIFLAIAYVLNLVMCALGVTMVHVGGVGRRHAIIQATNPELLVGWAKCIYAFEILYYTTVALPKMGIVLMYVRVFNWRGVMRGLAIGLLCLLAATFTSFVITAVFKCRPIAYWWDRTIPGGKCINVQAWFHAQTIPGIILDFIIMALPLRTIWGLGLPMPKKIALVGIFAVGSVGIVASIIRAAMFFSTSAFEDRTRASVLLVGFSILEASMYIIAACLPHLRPLVARHAPDWFLSIVRKSLSQTSTGKSKIRSSPMGSRPIRRTHQDDEMELTSYSATHGISSPGGEGFDSLENGNSDAFGKTASRGQVLVTTEVNVEHESRI
ncbi:integral membrane protein [Plectosphaerella plurivora]|uniref:Integral membrane protein n=1 Tax=Plectosphaerella plurivora TaxID=936078 RepID=A0A9P8VL62_9PEZI|nr:integral membrane protein [Plectosphaerella plurivora]